MLMLKKVLIDDKANSSENLIQFLVKFSLKIGPKIFSENCNGGLLTGVCCFKFAVKEPCMSY